MIHLIRTLVLDWFLPITCPFHCPLPVGVQSIGFFQRYSRFVARIQSPLLGQFLLAVPESYYQSYQLGGTKSCGFRNLGHLHGYADQVSLKLHKKRVSRTAAVSPKQGDI